MSPLARQQRQRRRRPFAIDANLALRLIGVCGVVLWLFLTLHFHHALDVHLGNNHDNGRRPPSSRPATPDAVRRERELDAAAARGKAMSLRKRAALAAKGGQSIPEPEPVKPPPPVVKPPPQSQHHANNKIIKAPPSINSEEGISACLLVNDENPRLPEWIAYHYLTLPLRSLIVTVDPASRSAPHEILMKWYSEMGLYVNVWSEKKFLHPKMRGPCATPDDPDKCLWRHRDRQQYFVNRCMLEFRRLNKTWVLLTDVDEYVVFNEAREDDPPAPLDEAPEGVPVMSDWRYHNSDVGSVHMGMIDGYVDGRFERRTIDMSRYPNETFVYGTVVTDLNGKRFFLRDDVAHQEATALHSAPPGIPTLKDPWFAREQMYVRIWNDTYDDNPDDAFTPVAMDWKMGDAKMRAFHGGMLIEDKRNKTYYVEFEAERWPRRYKASDSLEARRRLPSIGDGTTVLDVLKKEGREGYANGKGLGPCLSMPRLLYGSREDNPNNDNPSTNNQQSAAPEGFDEKDFVTLRYKWHASKGEFDASRYGKTIIDVSRIPEKDLRGTKALNIHRPLAYHCRKDPPRYAVSLFRVNHYLDSFEAFSYRNDARSQLRQCKECYEKKGSGAAVEKDDDVRPWLRRFVEEAGHEKARTLLAGAGEFVKLG